MLLTLYAPSSPPLLYFPPLLPHPTMPLHNQTPPHLHPPLPLIPTSIRVLARWASYGLWSRRTYRNVPGSSRSTRQTHVYTLATAPQFPLYEGGQVILLAVTREVYYAPYGDLLKVALYDPHIQGCITKIVPGGRGRALVTVVNECRRNPVDLIMLDVPLHPSVINMPGLPDDDSLSAGEEQMGLLAHLSSDLDCSQVCQGMTCDATVHEVADARIGQEVVEISEDEASSSENVQASRRLSARTRRRMERRGQRGCLGHAS